MVENRKRFRRIDQLGDAHFLTWSCFRRQPFFKSERCCRWLAGAIRRATMARHFLVWGFVFMPDHVHLLLLPTTEEPSLSTIAKSIKQSASRRAVAWLRRNKRDALPRLLDRQPNGKAAYRLWERGPGYDQNITDPLAIHTILTYIHDNPVRK